MSMKEYVYATFHSTTDSIKAEAAFKASEIKGRLVIIPRELSAGCGMAWRSEPEWQAQIEEVAKANEINLKQVAIL